MLKFLNSAHLRTHPYKNFHKSIPSCTTTIHSQNPLLIHTKTPSISYTNLPLKKNKQHIFFASLMNARQPSGCLSVKTLVHTVKSTETM